MQLRTKKLQNCPRCKCSDLRISYGHVDTVFYDTETKVYCAKCRKSSGVWYSKAAAIKAFKK